MLDIETAPNLAYVWGLFKQNISISQIVDSSYVLCYAAKWHNEDHVFFDSIHKSKTSKMLKGIHNLMSEADAICTWNGNRFDIPTLNKEFLLHRMTPPSTYKQIDLLQTARNRFRFASNKLDYIAQALGVGKKHQHQGFELWVKCMNKDPVAWEEMETYNKQDVLLLEEVYKIFLPWIRNHPNIALYTEDAIDMCPNCGSHDLVKRGFSFTASGKYQRYCCSSCGTWARDRLHSKQQPNLISDKV